MVKGTVSSIQLMGATTYMRVCLSRVIDTITTDILAILSCGTVGDGQTTADEVILYINNYKGRLGFHNLDKDFLR